MIDSIRQTNYKFDAVQKYPGPDTSQTSFNTKIFQELSVFVAAGIEKEKHTVTPTASDGPMLMTDVTSGDSGAQRVSPTHVAQTLQ